MAWNALTIRSYGDVLKASMNKASLVRRYDADRGCFDAPTDAVTLDATTQEALFKLLFESLTYALPTDEPVKIPDIGKEWISRTVRGKVALNSGLIMAAQKRGALATATAYFSNNIVPNITKDALSVVTHDISSLIRRDDSLGKEMQKTLISTQDKSTGAEFLARAWLLAVCRSSGCPPQKAAKPGPPGPGAGLPGGDPPCSDPDGPAEPAHASDYTTPSADEVKAPVPGRLNAGAYRALLICSCLLILLLSAALIYAVTSGSASGTYVPEDAELHYDEIPGVGATAENGPGSVQDPESADEPETASEPVTEEDEPRPAISLPLYLIRCSDVGNSDLYTMSGNYTGNVICLYSVTGPDVEDGNVNYSNYVTYPLKGCATRFTALLHSPDYPVTSSSRLTYRITGDDEVLFESVMGVDAAPASVSIDVTGVEVFTILVDFVGVTRSVFKPCVFGVIENAFILTTDY